MNEQLLYNEASSLPAWGYDITCLECKDKLYPDDPTQICLIRGHYHKSMCHYCPNFNNTSPLEPIPEPQWTKRQRYQIDQLKGELRHYQNKVVELSNKSKQGSKRDAKYI